MATTSVIRILPKKLNSGQEAIFRLICDKYERDEQLTGKEIFNIYIKKVQVSNYWWDFKFIDIGDGVKQREYFKVKYNKATLAIYAKGWFIRTLGTLITKGYVDVLPKFDLNFKKIEA